MIDVRLIKTSPFLKRDALGKLALQSWVYISHENLKSYAGYPMESTPSHPGASFCTNAVTARLRRDGGPVHNDASRAPVIADGLEFGLESGPVLVTVEYLVSRDHASDFLKATVHRVLRRLVVLC